MTTQTPRWRRWRWWVGGIALLFVAFVVLGLILDAVGYDAKDTSTAAGSTSSSSTAPTTTSNATSAARPAVTSTTTTTEPPLTDFTPPPKDADTECASFAYGHGSSGSGTSVFLNLIFDDGPFHIVIHRSTGADYQDDQSPRFAGATVIQADYPSIDYASVTGVEVSDGGKAPCTITTHD